MSVFNSSLSSALYVLFWYFIMCILYIYKLQMHIFREYVIKISAYWSSKCGTCFCWYILFLFAIGKSVFSYSFNALKYWEQSFCSFGFMWIRLTCIGICGIVCQEQLNCEKTALIILFWSKNFSICISIWCQNLHFQEILAAFKQHNVRLAGVYRMILKNK